MSALATAGLSHYSGQSTVRASAKRTLILSWLYPTLPCVALLACILFSNPFNEAGFNDDWSYARVAMKLAQNGRMQYNGWGSPILLFQSFWALPWIRAFGFSLPVLQASMVPISLGFVLLVYATGRAVGLSGQFSAFASIAAGTSPLFVPLAASFMTDAPGGFFSLLCVYAALRCVQAVETRVAARWLWVLALAGIAGGANRQIVWVAPIVLIPYLLWARRKDAGFRLHAFSAYAASGLTILTIVHFFGQPYGPLQMSHAETLSVFRYGLGKAANLIASMMLVCILAALPGYCCFLPLARRLHPAAILGCLLALVPATFGILLLTGLVAPYGNCILSWVGIATEGQEWFRTKPASLAPWIRIGLSGAVNLCVLVSLLWLGRVRDNRLKTSHGRSLTVFAVFSLGYLSLVLPGALLGFAFDRYMLPLLPLLILAVLLEYSRHRNGIPFAAWCCVLAFSLYGVATTHDYFAALRARAAAVHALERTGLDRDRVSAGFEFDGWTELERSEYVSVVQYRDLFTDDHAKGLWFWFWDHTPNLRPDFVVLNWNSPEPVRGGEFKVDFRAWLPPYRRSAVVWKRSDLTGTFQAVRVAALLR